MPPWRICQFHSGRRSHCAISTGSRSPTSPSILGELSMAPRRSWRAPAPRCAGSTKRDTTMPADPLDALRLPIVPVEPRLEFAEALLRRMQSVDQSERRTTPTIRYFVGDIDTAVDFY